MDSIMTVNLHLDVFRPAPKSRPILGGFAPVQFFTPDSTRSHPSVSLGEAQGRPAPDLQWRTSADCGDPAVLLHGAGSWQSRSSHGARLTSEALSQTNDRSHVLEQCPSHIDSAEIGGPSNFQKALTIETGSAHQCWPSAQWAGEWFEWPLLERRQLCGGVVRCWHLGSTVPPRHPVNSHRTRWSLLQNPRGFSPSWDRSQNWKEAGSPLHCCSKQLSAKQGLACHPPELLLCPQSTAVQRHDADTAVISMLMLR